MLETRSIGPSEVRFEINLRAVHVVFMRVASGANFSIRDCGETALLKSLVRDLSGYEFVRARSHRLRTIQI
jgi:hypothetical protein